MATLSELSVLPPIHGIHHVTVIAGNPQKNIDFYTGVLGLRLVKKSVNQDSPDTYHFFYADGAGSPGTDLTFFPWPGLPASRPGYGQIVEVPLAVPVGSAKFWEERFADLQIDCRAATTFGETCLEFSDPDGLRLALVETSDHRDYEVWQGSPVPPEHQIMGMHSIRMLQRELRPSTVLLEKLFRFNKTAEENGWTRYEVNGGGSGKIVDIKQSSERGSGGRGGVHHVAWRTSNSEEEMQLRNAVANAGLQPTSLIDRFWFKSVYFREPGGVLYELATDGPGFTTDESIESLGESLVLPPWLEDQREAIEARLPDVST